MSLKNEKVVKPNQTEPPHKNGAASDTNVSETTSRRNQQTHPNGSMNGKCEAVSNRENEAPARKRRLLTCPEESEEEEEEEQKVVVLSRDTTLPTEVESSPGSSSSPESVVVRRN